MLITFRGTSIHLKTITGPTSGIVYVSLDGSSTVLNKLQRNAEGRAVLDLYSPRRLYGQDQLIADGLSFDKHILQITVSGLHNSAAQDAFAFIDGFEVGN